MKLADVASEMQSLLDAPSPAALTLYRADGEALVSPVWFRLREGFFEVVVAATDRKLEHPAARSPMRAAGLRDRCALPGRPGTGQADTRARRRRPYPPGHRLALSRRCAWPQVRGPRPSSTRLHRPPCDESTPGRGTSVLLGRSRRLIVGPGSPAPPVSADQPRSPSGRPAGHRGHGLSIRNRVPSAVQWRIGHRLTRWFTRVSASRVARSHS